MSLASPDLERPAPAAARPPRPPAWALTAVVVAVAAVVVALVVGLRGLFADPIKGTAPDGTTIIQGTFEPWASGGDPVQGYIQAGSRSVFVILPRGCPAPPANSDVAVHGRLDTTQGKGTYRAVGCAS